LVQESIVSQETVESKGLHDDPGWDPDWISRIFTAWGKCSYPSCKEDFAIAGTAGVDVVQGEEGEQIWADFYSPKSCFPMPEIFEIPTNCSDGVKAAVHAAFSTFWLNQAACAGRIRAALEFLMNDLGLPKRKKGVNGKYFHLSLHN
jgi:hypothetical protein